MQLFKIHNQDVYTYYGKKLVLHYTNDVTMYIAH